MRDSSRLYQFRMGQGVIQINLVEKKLHLKMHFFTAAQPQLQLLWQRRQSQKLNLTMDHSAPVSLHCSVWQLLEACERSSLGEGMMRHNVNLSQIL